MRYPVLGTGELGRTLGGKLVELGLLGEFGRPAERVVGLGGTEASRAGEMWLPL